MRKATARKSKLTPATATATDTTAAAPAVDTPAPTEPPAPRLVSIPAGDEFSVAHADLRGALARITSVVDKRSTLPILSNVAMRATGDHVELVGTDLGVYLTLRLATVKAGRFGTTVSAHRLASLVRTLPDGEVAIARSESVAKLYAGRVTCTLDAIPDRDFPKIPTLGDLPWATADAKVLRAAAESVMFSVCTDETRFHLAGALLESDGSTLTMVSTDGHRLTKVRQPWAWSGASLASGIIIPTKGLVEIRKLLAGHDTCEIGLAKPFLFVRVKGAELAIKLTDAQFPPYEQVIPKDYTNLVTVASKPLRVAMERAKLITSDTRGVRWDIEEGVLTVSSDDPDVGRVSETIDVDYKGKSLRWGLNPIYLLQLLDEMDADSLTISFKGELDPILVRSTDDAAMRPIGEASLVGVIMPMRV